ncbi:hypothetical protein [Microbacterium maritypicum]
MTIQPRLELPQEILDGLASGAYKLFGSVVRDAAKGFIVKHLPDAPTEATTEAARKAVVQVPALKNPWVIGATLAGTVVAIATVAYLANKQKQTAEEPEEAPVFITRYREALRAYLAAAREGQLNDAVIARLVEALDTLRAETAEGAIAIESSEESEQVVSLIIAHTRALAQANGMNLDDLLEPVAEGDRVDELRQHLEVQRRIFAQED